MNIFNKVIAKFQIRLPENRSAFFSIFASLLILAVWFTYKETIRNEFFVFIKKPPQSTEKMVPLKNDESYETKFKCKGEKADRWMLGLYATSDLEGRESNSALPNFWDNSRVVIEVSDADPIEYRLELFARFSGIYFFPITKKSDSMDEVVNVRVSLKDNSSTAVAFFLAGGKDNKPANAVTLVPEASHLLELPPKTVWPRTLRGYKSSGECVAINN